MTSNPTTPSGVAEPADERAEEIEAVIACLGDDAASLRQDNPEDERAANMERAAELLEALAASQAASHSAPAELVAKALRPFAKLGGPWDSYCFKAFQDLDDDAIVFSNSGFGVTAGDVRAARKALEIAALASPAQAPSTEPILQDKPIAWLTPDLRRVASNLAIEQARRGGSVVAGSLANYSVPAYRRATPVQPVPASPAHSLPATPTEAMVDAFENAMEAANTYIKNFPAAYKAMLAAAPASPAAPIDMVLHCPACGKQHVDAVEDLPMAMPGSMAEGSAGWVNPPHRSHLCHACGHIWRPADVPTNGVQAVKTTGKADSPIAAGAVQGLTPTDDQIMAAVRGFASDGGRWPSDWIAAGRACIALAATTTALPASNEVKP